MPTTIFSRLRYWAAMDEQILRLAAPGTQAECPRCRSHFSFGRFNDPVVDACHGRSGDLRFRGNADDTRHIWSTGDAWGRWQQHGRHCTLTVSEGTLKLVTVTVTGLGRCELGAPRILSAGERLEVSHWPGT